MTLTNFDASQVTLKQRQKALYAWKSQVDAIFALGGKVILSEQPTAQSGALIADRNQGGCKCSTDALSNPYEFNGLTKCGC
jgi:hypothetical protein